LTKENENKIRINKSRGKLVQTFNILNNEVATEWTENVDKSTEVFG
jgi:hypothetical protein